MPISRLSFVRFTLLMLLVGISTLVAITGTSIWLVGRTQGYVEQITAGRQVRAASVDMLGTMQAAEAGQRGYLLTGDEAYLTPFAASSDQLPARIKRLQDVTAADPEQRATVDKLVPMVEAKMTEMAETIRLAKAGDRDQAMALVRTDQGRKLMDDSRAMLTGLISSVENVLTVRVAEQRASGDALWWVTVCGSLVILAVTLGGAWTIVRYTQELSGARREVEVLNTGLEERVRERTSELGRANDEIQRFAYIVTHDLRAPLVNIMGFTSELETSLGALQKFIAEAPEGSDPAALAEARLAAQEDLPEALGFIRSSTRKMDGLINAILKLSREGRRTLKPETIDLGALLKGTTDAIGHQLIESDGVVDLAIAVPSIVSDRLSLEQVFGNLLDNAVKYRAPDRPLRIKVSARPAIAGQVTIDIEDNGRGIADQDHERVFELFRRSGVQDKAGEGIGLAHVRTLVRNLGGDITLRSRFGQGTTFSISLPRDLRAFVGSRAT